MKNSNKFGIAAVIALCAFTAQSNAQTAPPVITTPKTVVAITGQKVKLENATTTNHGLIAIATDNDITTGTRTDIAVTPAQLTAVAKPVLTGEFPVDAAAVAAATVLTIPTPATAVLDVYINGVKIPRAAWTFAGLVGAPSNTVTYVPAGNDNYAIELADLVSFTYRN
jgi:hypothetical protein